MGDRTSELSDALLEALHGLWLDGERHGAGAMCSQCGTTEDVEMIGAMTAYHHDPGAPDPNAPEPYCPKCAEEYRDHWQSQWDEYLAGCL